MLGPMGGIAFKEGKTGLAKGEALFLFSDGVTEAMNPTRMLYGEERLEDLLGSHDPASPEELISLTLEDIGVFAAGAEQSDDITMLALNFLATPIAGEARSFSLRMKNQLSEVGDVLAAFDGFARETEIPGEATQKVKLAFDELLNNIVSYGFPYGGEHEIDLYLERKEERLKIPSPTAASPSTLSKRRRRI